MNQKQYNQVVDSHADALYRFLLKSTRNKATAEDLMQTSFERLWKNKKKVEFQKAKSYLFTIAYNAMIDFFRKNKREYTTDQVPEQSTQMNLQFELKQWIELGLKSLNEVSRSLIMLRDYEGYSYREIGEITNLSESQVKVYIFRARKALQEYFKTHHKQELSSYGYSV